MLLLLLRQLADNNCAFHELESQVVAAAVLIVVVVVVAHCLLYRKCHSSRGPLTNCQLIWEMLQPATAASAFGRSVNMCRFMCVRYHTQTVPLPTPPSSLSQPCLLLCICIGKCGAAVYVLSLVSLRFYLVFVLRLSSPLSQVQFTRFHCARVSETERERERQCIVSLI